MKDIKAEGLHIMLDGFGRQVFMDFRVEQERHGNLWNNLAAKLGSGGIINPDAALEEIRLQPIHTILRELLSQDRITALASALRKTRTPSLDDDTEALLANLAKIYRQNTNSRRREISNCVQLANNRLKRSAKSLRFFNAPSRRLRRFTSVSYDEATYLGLWSLLVSLQYLLNSFSESEQGIWCEWGLENFLSQLPFAQDNSSLIQALRTALAFGSFKNTHPLEALSELISNPIVRESCGINFWNNTLWYNKEGWELSVRSILLSARVDSSIGSRPLRRILRKWRKAHRRAGYRVASLLDACR